MKLEGLGTPTELPDPPIKAAGKTDGEADGFGSLLGELREPEEPIEMRAKPQAATSRDGEQGVEAVDADAAETPEETAEAPSEETPSPEVGSAPVEGERDTTSERHEDDDGSTEQEKPRTPVQVVEVGASDTDDAPPPEPQAPTPDPLARLETERPEVQTPEPTQAERVVAELKAVTPVEPAVASVEAPAPTPVSPAPHTAVSDKPQPAPANQPTVDADAVVVRREAKGDQPSSGQSGQPGHSDRRSEQQPQAQAQSQPPRSTSTNPLPSEPAVQVDAPQSAKPQAAAQPAPSVAERQAQQAHVVRAEPSAGPAQGAPAAQPAPAPVVVESVAPTTTIEPAPSAKAAPTPSASAGAQPEASEAEAQRITDRVVKGLRSVLNQRGGTLTLRLSPAELGAMRIAVKMDGAAVSAQFQATTAVASQALNQNIATLRQALEAQGLTVEHLNVQVQPSGNSSQAQTQTQQNTDQSPTDGQSKGLMRDGEQAQGGRGDGREDQPDRRDFQQELLDLVA